MTASRSPRSVPTAVLSLGRPRAGRSGGHIIPILAELPGLDSGAEAPRLLAGEHRVMELGRTH